MSLFDLRIAEPTVSPPVACSGSNYNAEELSLTDYKLKTNVTITRSFGTALSSTYVKCSEKERQLLPVKKCFLTIWKRGHTKTQWLPTERLMCFLGLVAKITSL